MAGQTDLLEVIRDPGFVLDRDYRIVRWNAAMAALTGAPADSVLGRVIFDVVPAGRHSPVHAACDEVLRTGEPVHVGQPSASLLPGRYVSTALYPSPDGVLILARDVTEQHELQQRLREREAQLEAAIAERDFLLYEMKHRVANGIQAMLSLHQLRGDTSPHERASLRRLGERLSAMSRLHDHLSRDASMPAPDVGRYLRALVQESFTAFGDGDTETSVEVSGEPGTLAGDVAPKVGMILAELITNVFKHAVPSGAQRCHVAITGDPEGLRIRVEDDGPGIAPDAARAGTGLREAGRLLDDLGGALEVERIDDGTEVRVYVPTSSDRRPPTPSSSSAST